MTRRGNKYSTDGSYDFQWDHTFPVDGDILWPKGKLLQLQRLRWNAHFRERNYVVSLFPDELVIGELEDPELDSPWTDQLPFGWEFYRFYCGELVNEQSFDVSNIEKIELGLAWVTWGITIWARREGDKAKRVLKAGDTEVPRVIKEVADESVRQGVAQPAPKLVRNREMYLFQRQLLHRTIERQFQRCASHVEIDLVGEHMPEEVFRRIVK